MAQITIIGAGPGISQGVAKLFGAKGFDIALIARQEGKLQQLAAELEAEGIRTTYAVADAGNEQSLLNALGTIRERLGHADMILYNASASSYLPLEQDTWENIRSQFDVNVGGAFHLLKRVLPWCRQENKGKLFFTGGGLSMYPQPMLTGLSIGKAGMRNLVYAAAAGVQNTNIHIATVTVCGFVRPDDPKYNPAAIAELYWKLYNQQPGEFETEIIY